MEQDNVASIFNEVLGPVMVGRSSSHTAGPHRIGELSRMLLGEDVAAARIAFDPGSSYAAYCRLQWSDRGFAAGLLGIKMDDAAIADALKISGQKGVPITFVKEKQASLHANFAVLDLMGKKGGAVMVDSISIGGAAVEITAVDGFPVSIKGDFNASLLYMESSAAADAAEGKLADLLSFEIRIGRGEKEGKVLLQIDYNASLTEAHKQALAALPGVSQMRHVRYVLPVMSQMEYNMPFTTCDGARAYLQQHPMSAGELGIAYEMARSGKSRDELISNMRHIIKVMRQSAYDSTHNPTDEKIGGFYPLKATELYRNRNALRLVDLGVLNDMFSVAVGVVENVERQKPGVVVASPTVGSAGIIPAAVVGLGDSMGLPEEEIALGMFAAGVIGVFISHLASFSGELAGCQAECGSAGSMAAAGVVELCGGSAEEAFAAAAISLQNLLGLICDPVSVGYEPCNARNSMAVANAMITANMVLAGYKSYIPFDETAETMMRVGRQLPACLKCTHGGLACTTTGLRIADFCEGPDHSL